MRVVKEWLDKLTLKQQTVLLCAIRGCDGVPKGDISKELVRLLRETILENACPFDNTSEFMQIKASTVDEIVKKFLKQPDIYPVHWLFHFMHAVEIIGYNHPHEATAKWWLQFYNDICYMLHVNPETKYQNDIRLTDGSASNCWKEA